MDLLILDDFGLEALQPTDRKDLLEIIEDRHKLKSTLITSQLAVKHWHEHIGEPTIADAILDRLMNHAYKIELKGDSMRRTEKIDLSWTLGLNKQLQRSHELAAVHHHIIYCSSSW